jgi:hypothetical protein
MSSQHRFRCGLRSSGGLLASFFLLLWSARTSATAPTSLIHEVDFAGESGVSTYSWLEARKFILAHDAKDKDKITLSQSAGALHLHVVEQAFGFIIHEQDVPGANHVRLHWGVSSYPDGAAYERGVDNEAIMVYVFFGHEKFPSGSLFVPDSPYFIGFYLCQEGVDTLEKAYVGHHYKKTGRYICVDHPESNEKVVTEIDLGEEFRKSFGRDDVPAVSGMSIEVDTTDSQNDGKAAAFLQRIEFLK